MRDVLRLRVGEQLASFDLAAIARATDFDASAAVEQPFAIHAWTAVAPIAQAAQRGGQSGRHDP